MVVRHDTLSVCLRLRKSLVVLSVTTFVPLHSELAADSQHRLAQSLPLAAIVP
jgi:hypothetical protein